MPYTVQRLLDDQILEECELITKKPGLTDRTIHAASVQELPMRNFLTPHDIVLTTALGSDKDPDIIRQVLMEAGESDACGVLFSFMEDQELNEEMRLLAESLNLNVIRCSWEIAFTDIQGKINQAIRDWELEVYRVLQGKLFEAYFDHRNLKKVVQMMEETLDEPVALFNGQGSCLAASESYQMPEESEESAMEQEEGPAYWTIPIGAVDYSFGHLSLQGEEPKGTVREDIPQYLAYPLSLWFNQIRVEEMTTAQLRSDFARKLARGSFEQDSEMIRQANLLDVNLYCPYYCVVMTIHAGNQQLERKILESAVDIMGKVQKDGRELNRHVITGSVGNQFEFFIEPTPDMIPGPENPAPRSQAEDEILLSLEEYIEERLPHSWCLWGFSSVDENLPDFVQRFNEAMLAIHYGDRRRAKNQKLFFREARSLQIMSAVSGKQSVRHEAERVLGNLIEYDAGSGSMELMKTLTAFIQNNYNTSQTARALSIHRQSLLARLRKIEDLSGLSLKNHEDLFVLEVYTRIYVPYA